MNHERFDLSLPALAAALLLYYVTDAATLLAILLPVAVHELGHILAIRLCCGQLRSVQAELTGICISYTGCSGALDRILCALSGPAAGLIYAWGAAQLGERLENDMLLLSSGISLALSLFNLLPCLPLDGGQITQELCILFFGEKTGEELSGVLGAVTAAALLAAGIYAMKKGFGAALEVSALWILLAQKDEKGLAKRRFIM